MIRAGVKLVHGIFPAWRVIIYQMFIIVYNNTIIERKRHIGLCVWTHILERLDIDRRQSTLDTHSSVERDSTHTRGACGLRRGRRARGGDVGV